MVELVTKSGARLKAASGSGTATHYETRTPKWPRPLITHNCNCWIESEVEVGCTAKEYGRVCSGLVKFDVEVETGQD